MDIFSIIILGFLLYIVVFLAVKHGINYSELGLLIKKKYNIEEKTTKFSNEDIEKMLEKENSKQD